MHYEYVNSYISTQIPEEDKLLSAMTRLTAHFMRFLMSDLAIYKHGISMFIHNTECPHWDQLSRAHSQTFVCMYGRARACVRACVCDVWWFWGGGGS